MSASAGVGAPLLASTPGPSPPLFLTSGTPCSPALTHLTRHFPNPLSWLAQACEDDNPEGEGEEEEEEVWADDCVIHEDVPPYYQLKGPLCVERGAVLRPPPLYMIPAAAAAATSTTAAIQIGPYVFVGEGAVCESVGMKPYSFVGPRAVLGAQVVLSEGSCVEEGSAVPAEAILAAYTVYRGVPAVPVGRVDPVSHRQAMEELVRRWEAARRQLLLNH